jgi:hypothetical protein
MDITFISENFTTISKVIKQEATLKSTKLGKFVLTKDEYINNVLNSYYYKNKYKKISHKDFIKTSEYFDQRMNFFLKYLNNKYKSLENYTLITILQEQLIALAIPILTSVDSYKDYIIG